MKEGDLCSISVMFCIPTRLGFYIAWTDIVSVADINTVRSLYSATQLLLTRLQGMFAKSISSANAEANAAEQDSNSQVDHSKRTLLAGG